jgi:sodium/potassium-transporting ATPase subunit alpha
MVEIQGVRSNALIILGVVSEIVILLLINYTPWGNALLGTAPIGEEIWVFVIPFAAGMLILEELRKWLARRRLLHSSPGNGAGSRK